MKISFEIEDTELKDIIVLQIQQSATKFFDSHKETFIKGQVEKHVQKLKHDGFFARQVSSSLNKAIFDKVNREFSEHIQKRLYVELDKVLKAMKVDQLLVKMVDQKVKEKIKFLIDKTQ